MGKKEDAWILGNLGWHWSTQLWTSVVFVHSLFVECSVPCSCMPSWLMYYSYIAFIFSLVAQTVKRLPTMRETWVQPLGWQDLLDKEMATHLSILAWKIPWMEEPGRLWSMGSQRVRHDWATSLHFIFFFPHKKVAPFIPTLQDLTYSLNDMSWRLLQISTHKVSKLIKLLCQRLCVHVP